MSPFESASNFFHALDSLKGWAGCQAYVADEASFSAQSEPLVGIDTVKDYCEWMANIGKGPLKGCSYTLNSSAYDDETRTAFFYATITATHVGAGGPVPATNKQTKTDYVYVLKMNADGKVEKMRKIWPSHWSHRELGWP